MSERHPDSEKSVIRVGLDVTQAAKSRGRGIAAYIRQLIAAMPNEGVEPSLYIRAHRWFRKKHLEDLRPDAPRRWLISSALLGTAGLDLFHSLGNHLPVGANLPLSFTLHDVRALDKPASGGSMGRLQRNIGAANGIICLTEYGRKRLLHHYPNFNNDLLAVIPHGVDHQRFRPEAADKAADVGRRYGITRPYELQLGSWFPHKNLELSIEAFARSKSYREGHQLVMIGGGAPDSYRDRLNTLVQRTGIADRLLWIEHVPGADLPSLLAGARCLLQPSRYEGFALPLLEAMASGLPGVVSNSSCLPEVSGGLWPIADTDDPDAFAEGLDRMSMNSEERNQAIDAGIKYASQFTWQRSARLHDDFYRRVVRHARSS